MTLFKAETRRASYRNPIKERLSRRVYVFFNFKDIDKPNRNGNRQELSNKTK